jgi:hypothetical protein
MNFLKKIQAQSVPNPEIFQKGRQARKLVYELIPLVKELSKHDEDLSDSVPELEELSNYLNVLFRKN